MLWFIPELWWQLVTLRPAWGTLLGSRVTVRSQAQNWWGQGLSEGREEQQSSLMGCERRPGAQSQLGTPAVDSDAWPGDWRGTGGFLQEDSL